MFNKILEKIYIKKSKMFLTIEMVGQLSSKKSKN